MRLIDADALPHYTGYALSADEVAMAVENAPTIDAVPVVRCKDCMYSETDDNGFYYCVHDIIGGYGETLDVGTFCSYGERKDDEID